MAAPPAVTQPLSPDTPESGIVRLYLHKSLPWAAFYFFFNAAGLPLGLFYTSLLSPFLCIWLYTKGQRWITTKFLLILSPFFVAHAYLGIQSSLYYLRTLLLLWTVYIAAYGLCWALIKTRRIDRLFEELIELNFLATLIALVLFPTSIRSLLWMDDTTSTRGASHLYRLNLLSIEPSAYALLMLPLLLFSVLRLFGKQNARNFLFLAMIGLPFLLCQSFGGLSMALAGIGIALLFSYKGVWRRPGPLIAFLALLALILLICLTPNPVGNRVTQVVTGSDSSTRSRTIFSYLAAYAVASSKNLWWGAGLGQAKLFDFSALNTTIIDVIPNSAGSTIAEFGLIGLAAKITAEIYLFFKLKVHRNSFSLAMFVVVFITQLTGSFLTNVQEYVMWCFAFYSFFPNLDLHKAKIEHVEFVTQSRKAGC